MHTRTLRRACLLTGGLLAAAAGLVVALSLTANPAQAGPAPLAAALQATPTAASPAASMTIESDQQCLDCHSQADQIMTLPSGEELYVTIDPQGVAQSAHAGADVGCRDCHANITAYPHPALAAQNLRDIPAIFSQQCQDCHEDQVRRYEQSVHAQIRASDAPDAANAAICSDCHNPHYQPLAEPRSKIVATCARCHSTIAQEYRTSVHGAAVMATENADVPLCIDCHGVHTIPDPRSMEWLNESPELCARCHADPQKMAPYGLNTNVLSTYVADFHGTTSVLFQKQTPDQVPNTPLCIDCHGIHNIKSPKDVGSSVMESNLLATCQKCHPNAGSNFPAAWLSHYTPTPDRHPLVYFVGLFYKIFIPAVLIPMAIFVVTDVRRLIVQRRQKGNH